MAAVADHHGHLQRRIKFVEYFFCDFDTGKNALFFNEKMLSAGLVGGDSAECGMVAVAHVFGKSQRKQIVDKLVFCFHFSFI